MTFQSYHYDTAVVRLSFPTRSPPVTMEVVAEFHAYELLGTPIIELHISREEALLAQLPALLTVGALVDVLPVAPVERRAFLGCRVHQVDPNSEDDPVGSSFGTPTFSAYLTPGGEDSPLGSTFRFVKS